MAMDAGSVFVRLGAYFDDRGFDKHQKAIRHARGERPVETKLGADVDHRGFKQYRTELDRAERESKATHRRISQAPWGSMFAGAAVAAGGAVIAIKSVSAAYGEAEVSAARMKAQLGAMGVSYKAHAKEIDAVIQKTSKLAGLDDEDLQDAFTKIARATGSVNVALRDMGLAADIARGGQMDAAQAGAFLAKIHAGNTKGLKGLGLAFTTSTTELDKLKATTKDASAEQIAAAKAADKQTDAQKALALLQDKFSGQAEKYGKTQKGAADRASVAWENLREKLGEKLAPTLTRVLNKTADFVNEMESGEGAGGRFAKRMEEVGKTLGEILKALGKIAGVLADHIKVVEALAAAWIAVKVQARLAAAAQLLAGGTSVVPGGKGPRGPVPVPGGSPGKVAAGAGKVRTAAAFAGPYGWALAGGLTAGLAVGDGDSDPRADRMTGRVPTPVRGRQPVTPTTTRSPAKPVFSGGKDDPNGPEALTKWYANLGKQLGVTEKEAVKLKQTMQFKDRPLKGLDGDELLRLRDRLRGIKAPTKDVQDELKQLNRAIDSSLGGPLKATLAQTSRSWDSFGKRTNTTIGDVRAQVKDNTAKIKHDLGANTKEGSRALAANFRSAAAAVKEQMAAAGGDTRDGTRAIRGYLVKSLRELGVSAVASVGDKLGDLLGGNKAEGGWIGAPGMVGTDTVPTMLAPGEAVLNRHQQAVIEEQLGGGYLDRLFANVRTPHYMASGGRVTGDTDYSPRLGRALQAMSRAAGVNIGVQSGGRTLGEQAALVRSKGLYSSSNPTGAAAPSPNAPHVRGIAADITPGRSVFGAIAGRFGLSFPLPAEPWHVEIGGGGGGGAVGAGVLAEMKAIKAPRTKIGGTLGALVQRSLDVTAAAATRYGRKLVAQQSGGGDGASGGQTSAGGKYDKAALKRLWIEAGGDPAMANQMAAIALAESGGNPNSENHNTNGTIDRGLWQINSIWGERSTFNVAANAKAAVAILKQQGIGAWSSHNNGSDRQFLARGGYAKGSGSAGYGASGETGPDRYHRTYKNFARWMKRNDKPRHIGTGMWINSLEDWFGVKSPATDLPKRYSEGWRDKWYRGDNYAKGGFVQHFAGGGKVKKTTGKMTGHGTSAAAHWKAPAGSTPMLVTPRASTEELDADEQRALTTYTTTRDELEALPAQIKAADKKEDAAAKALKKHPKGKDHAKYVKAHTDAKAAADKLHKKKAHDSAVIAKQRRAWQDAQKASAAARKFDARVAHLTSVANTAATEMDNAAKRGDRTAWLAAKKRRDAAISQSLGLAKSQQAALKKKTGPTADALKESIATLTGSVLDAGSEEFGGDSFSPEQSKILAGVDKAAALAALTDDGNKDDLSAAELRANYLRQFFNIAQANGASDSTITDLATQLKSAQDNVKSITESLNSPTADQQAVIDQQQKIIDLALGNAKANAQVAAVLTGTGDLGLGGGNAWGAAQPQVVQNNYMMHPSDPQVLDEIGRAAGAGMALQNGIQSSRQTVG